MTLGSARVRGSAGIFPLGLLLAAFAAAQCRAADPPARPDTGRDLEDSAAPLNTRRPRTASEEDQLTALALFAEGRSLAQRGEEAAALRKFQRAFRSDPQAVPILRELIPLAFNLDRNAEAIRYATKFARLDSSDPGLLRRLAVVLTEQGEWRDALALYEKTAAAEPPSSRSSAAVLLRMQMGQLYYLDDQPVKAAEAFAAVFDALENPADHGLNPALQKTLLGEKDKNLELVGQVFLETDQPDRAAAAFAKLDAKRNNPPLAAWHAAQVAARRKQSAASLHQLNVYFAARETTQGLAPYELLSRLLAADNRADQYVAILEKQLADQPGTLPLHFALAEHYRKTGRCADAVPRYETYLAKQASGEAYRGLVECLRVLDRREQLLGVLGEIVKKSGTLDVLLAEERKTRQLAESQPEPRNAPAAPQLGDPAGNRALCEFALEKLSGNDAAAANSLRGCGILAFDISDIELGGKLFDRALAAKPADKAETLLYWGVNLLQANKPAEAMKIFQRGIDERALPEGNPAFYFYLSGAALLGDDADAALAAAKVAAEKQPKNIRYAARIPEILHHAKRGAEAAKGFLDLLAKFDGNHEDEDIRIALREARLVLSHLSVLRNDLPDAEEWLEQVLDEFPDDTGAKNDLGYLWADQNKRLERALEMIEAAVAAEPRNAAFQDSLGWVLYRLGKYESALAAQLQALAPRGGVEPDGVVLDHLAEIYAKLNRRDEALRTWEQAERALEKTDPQGKIKEVRQKIAAAKQQPPAQR